MLDKMVSEQRLTKRLTSYWERLRGDVEVPQYDKFNSSSIAELWDFCFLVKVDDSDRQRLHYKYEYLGKEIIGAFGKDITGQRVTAQIHTVPGAAIIKRVDDCVQQKLVLTEDGKFINGKSKVVKYRSCMLPFAGAGDDIAYVVVGLSWRAF